MDKLKREHLEADAREAEEADIHAMNGELQCGVCGEWAPDFAVTVVKMDVSGKIDTVCDECLFESNEFKTCEFCGEAKHDDLMHDAITCKGCFEDIRITPDERVS